MNRRAVLAWIAAALASLTVAAPAQAVRFMVIGDWGAGSSAQARVAQQMWAEHQRARSSFVATVGDNFYDTGTARPATWQQPMKCLINLGLPWKAAWGNHDAAGGTSTATVLRSPRRWYSITPRHAVRLIFLDSNQPDNPDQLRWLKRVLLHEKGRRRPVIVLFHHPNRTTSTHSPQIDQRKLWEPLFLRYGVRLVLQGHNHVYERIHHNRLRYITSGGGGRGLYDCVRRDAELKICTATHQFLVIAATPRKIGVRAIDDSGRMIDSLQIVPAKR